MEPVWRLERESTWSPAYARIVLFGCHTSVLMAAETGILCTSSPVSTEEMSIKGSSDPAANKRPSEEKQSARIGQSRRHNVRTQIISA